MSRCLPEGDGLACITQRHCPPGRLRQLRRHGRARIFRIDQLAIGIELLPGIGEAQTVADWNKLSTRWKAELDDRISRLTRLRDQLSDCIGCGCLSIDVCKLRNPWDKLSEQGPGPRLLDQA